MVRPIQGDSIEMAQAKIREGAVLAVVVDEVSKSIVFNVRGAAQDGGSKSISLDLSKVHPDNIAYAALHGFKQRCGDAAALSRNPETGKPATPAEKFEAVQRLVEHYNSGAPEWALRASGEGRTSGELAMLTRAVAEYKGTEDFAKVRDWLKSKTDAERKALAVSAAIKPIMDRMREEAAAPVDAEDMLAELE